MNILDMVTRQKKTEKSGNYAAVLRYVPQFGLTNKESDKLDLAMVLERQLVLDEDWKDGSNEEQKELDLIHACVNIAIVDELHEDPNLTTDKQERCAKLLTRIILNSNSIRTETRRGAGNYALANNAFMKKIEELGGFPKFFVNQSMDGTEYLINGCIKMSIATFDEDIPTILIGYSGSANLDGGIALLEDDENNRYAIANRFYNTDKYYRVIKLK